MMMFQAALERVKRRIRTLFLRAIVESINDAKGIQLVQVSGLADEVLDGVERLQNYGMTSNPPPKSEAFIAFVGADRSNGVILAIENRTFRFKSLKPGEVCLYTDEGDYLKFSRGNHIEVQAGTKVTVTSPTIEEISSNHVIKTNNFTLEAKNILAKGQDCLFETPVFQVSGDILDKVESGGKTMASMRSTFNLHTHHENNPTSGSTNPPDQEM